MLAYRAYFLISVARKYQSAQFRGGSGLFIYLFSVGLYIYRDIYMCIGMVASN